MSTSTIDFLTVLAFDVVSDTLRSITDPHAAL
jgi:hypothetical protein